MARIRKAVIPAAGYGTRFLPATKATPKEMLPIVDKPTIQYIVEEALASGIEEILIISGHAKRAIEDHFDSAPDLERELEEDPYADSEFSWLTDEPAVGAEPADAASEASPRRRGPVTLFIASNRPLSPSIPELPLSE